MMSLQLLAVDDGRPVHAERHQGDVLQMHALQLVDDLLALGRIGLERPLPVEIDDALIAGPVVPGLVAVLDEVVDQRILDAGRGRVGEEDVPAALRGRRLGGAALDQGRPVHRHDVDREAHAAQRLRGDQHGAMHRVVGLVHQRDARAERARRLQHALGLRRDRRSSSGSMPAFDSFGRPQAKIAAHTW